METHQRKSKEKENNDKGNGGGTQVKQIVTDDQSTEGKAKFAYSIISEMYKSSRQARYQAKVVVSTEECKIKGSFGSGNRKKR